MRVLWLSHLVPYPPVSGALQRSFHLLSGVAARHEVTLLAFNQRKLLGTEEAVTAARAALEAICRRVVVHPIPADRSRLARARLVGRALLSSSPYVARWLDLSAYRADLLAAVRREAFDLVHVDTVGLAPHARIAGDLPVALNHHNVESHMMARRAEREASPLARAFFRREAAKLRRLEQAHAGCAGINLVVSELDRSRLLAAAPGATVTVCPNGTDPVYFRPGGTGPEEGHLLFLGGMSWYPNLNGVRYFVREVWPRLVRRAARAKLTVVGADPPDDLRRLAATDPRIRLTGQVADVRPYFDRADIFVCPILDGGGTRVKVLDAMAMAKPIVSTTLGCEGLDLAPERDYLAADTPEAFVEQICRLIDDSRLRAAMGERGRRVVLEQYAWARIVERLLAGYEGLVSREPARAATS